VTYEDWIIANVPLEPILARGKCFGTTAMMVNAFPELRRVRGHYLCPSWGRQEHWWCLAPDGTIVDPTGHQFPSCYLYPGISLGVYEPLPDDAEAPIGKCMVCGSYCWASEAAPSTNACSSECAEELKKEFA